MSPQVRLISVVEAAALLGVTPQRVRQLIDAGRIPARHVGRAWVIARRDVLAFAALPKPKSGRPRTRNLIVTQDATAVSRLAQIILAESGEFGSPDDLTSNHRGIDWSAAANGDVAALIDVVNATLGDAANRVTTVATVRHHQLDRAVTGVYWPDTQTIECIDHLKHSSWASMVSRMEDAKPGLALFGSVPCDACAEVTS